MNRKLYDRLLEWKREEASESALLIEGARRVGKSWIAEEFAKREYEAHLVIDFSKAGGEVRDLFENGLDRLDSFFRNLCAYYETSLPRGRSLVVFDEVQRFPRAREAIKALVADGRYHYIETGSLVSIRENTKDILIPSEETHVVLNPMDFEEFLLATGREELHAVLHDAFAERRSVGQAIHRKATEAFREYLIVGGMPQSVEAFRKDRDLKAADRVKRRILALYRDDISKHAGRYALKTRRTFDEIPAQLSKHEKKFSFASLGKNARQRDYEDAVFWLVDARIVNPCYCATEPNIGLKLNSERSAFKCYMADTGLLVSHAFDENSLAAESIHKRLLFGDLAVNEGMLAENMVAQMLVATGRDLYYYSQTSEKDRRSRMEIDFLVSGATTARRKNIHPVEVKSGKSLRHVSLDKFMSRFSNWLGEPYLLHTGDLCVKDGILYLPLYMAPFI